MRGFNCFRKDCGDDGAVSGGVCIFASNDYPSTLHQLNTTLQAVAVRIHITRLITVCSIYLPPHDVISREELDELAEQLPVPYMFLGDFNSHSSWWGSNNTNSRGRQVE